MQDWDFAWNVHGRAAETNPRLIYPFPKSPVAVLFHALYPKNQQQRLKKKTAPWPSRWYVFFAGLFFVCFLGSCCFLYVFWAAVIFCMFFLLACWWLVAGGRSPRPLASFSHGSKLRLWHWRWFSLVNPQRLGGFSGFGFPPLGLDWSFDFPGLVSLYQSQIHQELPDKADPQSGWRLIPFGSRSIHAEKCVSRVCVP